MAGVNARCHDLLELLVRNSRVTEFAVLTSTTDDTVTPRARMVPGISLADMGFVACTKIAVTALSLSILVEQVPEPEHMPFQPLKIHPALGMAETVTGVFTA